jgi:hypothetical protein
MRTQLLSAITSAISTLTQFATSQELPWEQNNQPLFRKNMKKVYIDKTIQEESTLIPTLDNVNVLEDNFICNAYLCVDAKNTPTQLDSVVTNILACKDRTGIVNFTAESDYTIDKTEDVLTYTFEFRLNTLKQ